MNDRIKEWRFKIACLVVGKERLKNRRARLLASICHTAIFTITCSEGLWIHHRWLMISRHEAIQKALLLNRLLEYKKIVSIDFSKPPLRYRFGTLEGTLEEDSHALSNKLFKHLLERSPWLSKIK